MHQGILYSSLVNDCSLQRNIYSSFIILYSMPYNCAVYSTFFMIIHDCVPDSSYEDLNLMRTRILDCTDCQDWSKNTMIVR